MKGRMFMPWCPKCKTEYREGFDTCNDCQEKLISQLSHEKERTINHDHEQYLMSTTNDLEAKVIESLLQSHGIPVLTKHKGTGGFLHIYMGGTNFGVDLYVPKRFFEKATELVEAENELQDLQIQEVQEINQTEEEKIEQIQQPSPRKKPTIKRLFSIFMLSWLILTILILLFQYLR
jgi:hypothetical protein